MSNELDIIARYLHDNFRTDEDKFQWQQESPIRQIYWRLKTVEMLAKNQSVIIAIHDNTIDFFNYPLKIDEVKQLMKEV